MERQLDNDLTGRNVTGAIVGLSIENRDDSRTVAQLMREALSKRVEK